MSNKLGRSLVLWWTKRDSGEILKRVALTESEWNGSTISEFDRFEKVRAFTTEELREELKRAFEAGIQAEISGPDFNHYAKELGL